MKTKLMNLVLGMSLSVFLATLAQAASPDEIRSLARDVYYYAYPIVLMDVTMRQVTAVPNAAAIHGRAPVIDQVVEKMHRSFSSELD